MGSLRCPFKKWFLYGSFLEFLWLNPRYFFIELQAPSLPASGLWLPAPEGFKRQGD